MRMRRADSLKQWPATITLIALAAILFAISAATGNAAQKPGRSAAVGRTSRIHELVRVDQLKEVFQGDSGKVRLVALVSPT